MFSTLLRPLIPPLLCLLAFFAAFHAIRYNEKHLSPQGCKMSWMSPSYVLQTDFNTSRTPLAKRYSLWLYREVGWENENTLHGSPVLFIPGNAGSSRQVRSIASSAIRQVYDSPYIPSLDYRDLHSIAPLDIFAAEFNEDFSALHGPTLLSQKAYVDAAIDFILSLYADLPSPPKQVLLIGHSMGGLVAVSTLPSDRVSGVITMSSPNSLPPARFDRRIEDLYQNVLHSLYPLNTSASSTPVLSLCGGATDSLIPSETCYLPHGEGDAYRKTVFTTGLEGTWTGVGHNEMVWCHQVRWRVARAALEMAVQSDGRGREQVLDRWFAQPDIDDSVAQESQSVENLAPHHTIVSDSSRILSIPSSSTDRHLRSSDPHLYLLPLPPSEPQRVTLIISRGELTSSLDVVVNAPGRALEVSLFRCQSLQDKSITCIPFPLSLTNVTTIPIPLPSKPFPIPEEGCEPGDVAVVVTASGVSSDDEGSWIGIRVAGTAAVGQRGLDAVLEKQEGGLNGMNEIILPDTWAFAPFLKTVSVPLLGSSGSSPLITDVRIPSFVMNALVVYRVDPSFSLGCEANTISPVLQLISSRSESHFHVLRKHNDRHNLLHTHDAGPFVSPHSNGGGMHFRVYSAPGMCPATYLLITVDWRSTAGRWALRYWSVVIVWGVGIVATAMARSWVVWEQGGRFADHRGSYRDFVARVLPGASGILLFISVLPLPQSMLLGNAGKLLFAPVAAICLWIAAGFVGLLMVVLDALVWLLGSFPRPASQESSESSRSPSPLPRRPSFLAIHKKRNVTAIAVILILVASVVPYQVAFVITWIILLWHCARTPSPALSSPSNTPIPLLQKDDSPLRSRSRSPARPTSPTETDDVSKSQKSNIDSFYITRHILLLQTFLIPLQAPVLAVWIRTLATAGYTAPFDGDHNVLMVAFWLVLIEGVVNGVPWERSKRRSFGMVAPCCLVSLGCYSVLWGVRYAFGIYEIANVVTAWLVLSRLVGL